MADAKQWTMAELDAECNRLFRMKDQLKAEGADKIHGGEYDRLLYRIRDLTSLRVTAMAV